MNTNSVCMLLFICLSLTMMLPMISSAARRRLALRAAGAEVPSSEETRASSIEEEKARDLPNSELPWRKEYEQIVPMNNTNSTDKNLYVIKAVVYEVGILTDVPENDTEEEVQNERIDISLFNSRANGSVIDLNHIPFPVQANVSGQVITGLAPVGLNNILGLKNNTQTETNLDEETESKENNDEDQPLISPLLTPYNILPRRDNTAVENK